MAQFHHYNYIFEPIKIGNMTVKNRLQFSPLVCSLSGTNGGVTREYLEFIKMQAATGVGVVNIGATSIDHDTGTDYVGELDITDDKNIIELLRLSEAAHRYGAKISIELVHAGRGANPELLKVPEAIAPSPIPVSGGYTHIREMNYADIEKIKKEYADCAERLVKAEFDMILLHAAHGNLIAQFLSPLFNKRTDQYGGSEENRWRFALEVLEAIRNRVGDKLAIDMRISGDEIIPGGMKIEDTIRFLKRAQNYLDTVHVSQGLIIEPDYAFYTMPPLYHPHCHNVKYAEAIKKDSKIRIPVTTVGSIMTMDEAEEILASGKADMVAMARQLLCDSMTIKNAYYGQNEKTRPCLRCYECTPERICHIRCATNPMLGREAEFTEVPIARKKKRTVVVGGGVAGCMAAKTLTERGHEVILLEKSDRLGGKLHEISCLSYKIDMRRHLEWLIHSTMSCGAEIRLNTEALSEDILALKPDAVFIATGSDRLKLPIPGIDRENVHHVLDVDTGKKKTGKRVVVCGGGLSGMECALGLAMEGKRVTVVDMIPAERFAHEATPHTRGMLLSLLDSYGVEKVGDSRVCAFCDKGVEIEDRNWRKRILKADNAVTAFGMKKNDSLYQEMKELLPEVYAIGDCDLVRNIKRANQQAFHFAFEC